MDTMTLVPATGPVAEAVIAVAVADAHPDDVTPPLTSGDNWTPERITWLGEYLTRCAAGLDDAGESVWAIVTTAPVGAVRLARSAQVGELETGI